MHVQSLTRSAFIAGGPTECFSKKMPARQASGADGRDLLPIDELYGRYFVVDRRIEIYVDAIRRDAHLFDADPEELLQIVRLHEYAHAVVHLGISGEVARAHLSSFGDDEATDWSGFMDQRTKQFVSLPEDVHELLAQAITYDALRSLGAEVAERMCMAFTTVEKRQPEIYKVPQEIKVMAGTIDWPLALDAARGEITAPRADGFVPLLGVRSLLCRPKLATTR